LSKILWKFPARKAGHMIIDRLFKKEIAFPCAFQIPIPTIQTFSKSPKRDIFLHFAFFSAGNISVIRHSAIPNSKFQILDGACFTLFPIPFLTLLSPFSFLRFFVSSFYSLSFPSLFLFSYFPYFSFPLLSSFLFYFCMAMQSPSLFL
jgi:hypothetical protein